MRLEPLSLDGVFKLVVEPQLDHRGFFARCYSQAVMEHVGLCHDFPEWSLSHNTRRGTLRGLHWQAAPFLETKLVRCTRGAIYDVVVDMRPASPTRGRWIAVELSAETRDTLYVPAGFAHGFQTLTDDAEILYHISVPFRAEAARGVRWDDADLAIAWPKTTERILSERDATLPLFADSAGAL